ncbi:PQQ-dependent sugar dehydrogenase [Singulisphaera sp. PoT]|uniref:PQQ-dependent sugar dehydrogenase n=1 Tax=Singulisphaera sp. PoT TaxID=3411797 RepID=UPI003BF48EF4
MLHRLRVATCLFAGVLGLGVAAVAQEPAPISKAVVAWPAGPLEVRVAFDNPIVPEVAQALEGEPIPFGVLAPADPKGLDLHLAKTLGVIRVAAVRIEDGGRTLVLATDPHPREATYLLTLPDLREPGQIKVRTRRQWAYTLNGAEASWTKDGADDGKPAWSLWWPELDPAASSKATRGSIEHEHGFAQLSQSGKLALRTIVALPKGKQVVRLESDAPVEATLAFEAPTSTNDDGGRHRAEWTLESTGDAVELAATITTGANGKAPGLKVTFKPEGDAADRPIPAALQTLPWAPSATPTSAPVPQPPFSLSGGDAARGQAVFVSEEAKCSVCHKAKGQGGDVGPSLDIVAGHDPAEVYRDINDPSAVINPQYVPYTISLKDGRVAVGVVRADGADAIKVFDINGQATRFAKAEIEEIHPSATSVMPVGLAGALGEAKVRDLLAFLVGNTPGAGQPVAGTAEATKTPGQPAAATDKALALPKLVTRVAFPNLTFDRPVGMAYPENGGNLLYVNEQRGVIVSFPNDPNTSDKKEFLDIRSKVYSPASGGHNEEGLLGFAFHPDFKRNGEFFVYYSSHEGPTGRRSVVSRFKAASDDPRKADPASEQRIWLGPPDPYGNHNGGMIAFGPDGYLYITLGDSGAADDPLTTGQDPTDFFGSILRIDVDHPADGKAYGIPKDNPRLRDPNHFSRWAPEVYCIGLRNVWKFSFDRANGTLWAGEVGQNLWEMVHIIKNGGNYGWSLKEGFHPFRPRQKKDPASPISPPLVEYPHAPNLAGSGRLDSGKSITGGYVYRGKALPKLAGVYVYGDYASGRIWGLREKDGKALVSGEIIDLPQNPLHIASFGEDQAGELYILGFDGKIHQLAAGR